MLKKALLLTYMFPPAALPEAFLSVKRVAHFSDYEIDVVTCPPYKKWMGNDTSLMPYAEKKIGEVSYIDVPIWIKKMPFWRLGPLSKTPDAAKFLNSRMLKQALNMCAKNDYDFILTWSQWHSIHLVGLSLKEKLPSIAWMSYFSDPWCGNPYREDDFISRIVNLKMERKVLQKSDAIFYSTSQTLESVSKNYPAEIQLKSYAFPHGFEPEFYSEQKEDVSGIFTVRYIGGLYGARNPFKLIEAINIIRLENINLLSNVVFEFIGPIDDRIKERLVAENSNEKEIRFIDSVPYLKSLELMRSADLLLIIDAPSDVSLFLPSKLIDYIGAGKPIVGLTPNGTPNDIILRLGGKSAPPDDLIQIKKMLESSLETYKSEKVQFPWGLKEERQKYRASSLGHEMQKKISEHLIANID